MSDETLMLAVFGEKATVLPMGRAAGKQHAIGEANFDMVVGARRGGGADRTPAAVAAHDSADGKLAEFSALRGMTIASTRRPDTDKFTFVGVDGREVGIWAYGYHAGELVFEGFDDAALTEADLVGRQVADLEVGGHDTVLTVIFTDGRRAEFLATDDWSEDPEIMCS